jgi:uncharacterized protein (DUF433 family)
MVHMGENRMNLLGFWKRNKASWIFENLEAGASIDDIMEWFEGLDLTQVKAVISFVTHTLKSAL